MTGAIVSRERELAALDEFLDAVPASAATLLIEGEAGIGKTTIWEVGIAGARERGWQVCVSRPVESEAKLSYAALGDLLEDDLEETLPLLPEPQRRALSVALLREEAAGTGPDQRAVAVAALSVLRSLANRKTVLLAVDDVQWLDAASAQVLEFALRRLRTEPVGALLAWRTESSDRLPLALKSGHAEALRRIHTAPLSLRAIHEIVVAGVGVAFDKPILRRIYETSGGNPFFALELARALQQQPGRVELGDGIPVPEELHELVGARFDGLPEGTRDALLVAAALSKPSLPLLAAVVAEDPEGHLAPAREAKVVMVEGEQVRFVHPLLASAAYSQASPARRRQVHRRLASVVSDNEERARHLALSTEGPDEEVAHALEEAARGAFLRGATHAAVELSRRACASTPGDRPEELRRRSLAEAEYRIQAGDSTGARDLLEAVLATAPSGAARAEVLSRLGDAHFFGVAWRTAAEVYRQALAEPGGTAAVRARSELDLSLVQYLLQEPAAEIAEHARAAVDLAELLDDPGLLVVALLNSAFAEMLLGHELQMDLIERACALEPWMDGVPVVLRPRAYLASVLAWTDDVPGAVGEYEAALRDAREHGDELSEVWLLGRLAQIEILAGAWREALDHIEEAEGLLLQAGQPTNRAFLLAIRAALEARLGCVSATREAAAEALELALMFDAPHVRAIAVEAIALLELSLERPLEADAHLASLVAATRTSGIHGPAEMRFVPDEIEALAALGRVAEAEELLAWFERCSVAFDSPSTRAAAIRCRGMIAAAKGERDDAVRFLEEARAQYERVPIPFDHARTLLALGSARRRARARRAARECLQNALAIFEQLGAATWAQRTRAELARIAGRAPREGELTTAERRVAELVAEGRTNKEVAAELVVTVRTVESTLTKAYAKLGVRSRTELARQLQSGLS
jgi:DNA-binding NarL/FixJ family response regulator